MRIPLQNSSEASSLLSLHKKSMKFTWIGCLASTFLQKSAPPSTAVSWTSTHARLSISTMTSRPPLQRISNSITLAFVSLHPEKNENFDEENG